MTTIEPKTFSGLQARAALLGVELRATQTDTEDWICYATAGAVTVELRTLAEVASLLASVERQRVAA